MDVPVPVAAEVAGREEMGVEVATVEKMIFSDVLRSGDAVGEVGFVPGAEEDVVKRPMVGGSVISAVGEVTVAAVDVPPVPEVTAVVVSAAGLIVPVLLERREEVVSKAELCA